MPGTPRKACAIAEPVSPEVAVRIQQLAGRARAPRAQGATHEARREVLETTP